LVGTIHSCQQLILALQLHYKKCLSHGLNAGGFKQSIDYKTFINKLYIKTKSMKKHFGILLMSFAVLFFVSCSTTSHTIDKVNLNGSYTVTDVRVEGVNTASSTHKETFNDAGNTSATILTKVKLETTVFDDVTPNCFTGSQWVLPHNGYGTYTIQDNGDCYAGKRNIVWSVRTDQSGQKKFQLKIIDGQKAKKVTQGYLLDITDVSQQGFTLVSPVEVDGQTAYVYYEFSRN